MLSRSWLSNSFRGLVTPGGLVLLMAALLVSFAVCTPSYATILLHDNWKDGDYTDSDDGLPTESPDYVGRPDNFEAHAVDTDGGRLEQTVHTSSEKFWTHYATDGNEVQLQPGQTMRTTVLLKLRDQIYDQSGTNYRFGLYNDPTDAQVHSNENDDGGGDGDPWTDSTGYQLILRISSGPNSTSDVFRIGKRAYYNSSLGGSSSAYEYASSGGGFFAWELNKRYRIQFDLSLVSASEMQVTGRVFDENNVLLASQSLSDTGDGGDFDADENSIILLPGADSGPWTTFEHLFFRTSNNTGTADRIDYGLWDVRIIPEPASLALLLLGGLGMLLWRRR